MYENWNAQFPVLIDTCIDRSKFCSNFLYPFIISSWQYTVTLIRGKALPSGNTPTPVRIHYRGTAGLGLPLASCDVSLITVSAKRYVAHAPFK